MDMIQRFQASPLCRRAGLVIAGDTRSQLTISVLPKLWREGPSQNHVVSWPENLQNLSIRLCEGDTCELHCSSACQEAVSCALDVSAEASQSTGRAPDGEVPEPLLQPIACPPRNPRSSGRSTSEGTPADLLWLWERTDPGSIFPRRTNWLPGTSSPARYVRPLLYALFVEEVNKNIRFVRRSYVDSEDALPFVRGRIVTRSLVHASLTNSPKVVCQFDEFTEKHPLFRIIATALEIVTWMSASHHSIKLPATMGSVVHVAAKLRKFISSIPCLPRDQAAAAARLLRLPRMDSRWQRALSLATLILEDTEYRPDLSQPDVFRPFEFSLSTSTVWEQLLLRAIRTQLPYGTLTQVQSGNARTHGFLHTPAPWKPRDGSRVEATRPDMMLELATTGSNGPVIICIDAKYKLLGPTAMPDTSDQYQLYAYSHLARLRSSSGSLRPADHCALIYPSRGQGGIRKAFDRLPEHPGTPSLVVADAAFPQAVHVRNAISWEKYLHTVGHNLVGTLASTAQDQMCAQSQAPMWAR